MKTPLSPQGIIQVAAGIADQDGLAAVTMSAVARILQVRAPSLYFHIDDLAALLDGVHLLALHDLADAIIPNIVGRSGRDALDGLADAHRDFAQHHPGLWAVLQRPASGDVASSPDAARIVMLMSAVLDAYRLPEVEFVNATRMVGATINGFISLEGSGGFAHSHPSPEISWRRALQALDTSLRHWPSDEETQ